MTAVELSNQMRTLDTSGDHASTVRRIQKFKKFQKECKKCLNIHNMDRGCTPLDKQGVGVAWHAVVNNLRNVGRRDRQDFDGF